MRRARPAAARAEEDDRDPGRRGPHPATSSGAGARRISEASRAGGAGESGLTRLIWAHAAHYTADAMIAVCLAGTIFFSAARSEQRTQVALYLLVTMAPFAMVAPFIGPALDRLQRGRRLALAATALGRGVLAWVMAAQFHNGLALYPAAFGALVLSKAYAVLKGACLPRVLPRRPDAGLGERTDVDVRAGRGRDRRRRAGRGHPPSPAATRWRCGSPRCSASVAAVLSLRLPAAVDSAEGEEPVAPAALTTTGPIGRRAGGLSLGPHVVTALRAAGALRGLSGFLTLFLAFWIQSTETGYDGRARAGRAGRRGLRRHRGRHRARRPDADEAPRPGPARLDRRGGRDLGGRRALLRPRAPRCSSSPRPVSPTRWASSAWTRSSSARCRTRCGPRRSPGRRRCCSWPGWSAAGSGSRCPRTARSDSRCPPGCCVVAFAAHPARPPPAADPARSRRTRPGVAPTGPGAVRVSPSQPNGKAAT